MTTMLDLLSSYLEAKEVQHCRIDGSISWQVGRLAGACAARVDALDTAQTGVPFTFVWGTKRSS